DRRGDGPHQGRLRGELRAPRGSKEQVRSDQPVPPQPEHQTEHLGGPAVMANPFTHVELGTTDLDKAKSFYRSLFEWQLEDVDMGGGATYTMIRVGEGTGGGMMKHPVSGAPSS